MVDVSGFRLKNSAGLTQIDQNHVVLQLRKKGTVTLADVGGNAAGLNSATVTYTGASEFALLAFKPSTAGDASIVNKTISGTTVTWTIQGLAPMTLSYYVFDRPVKPTGGNGAFVMDPTAPTKCLFSTVAPPMKVAAAIDWDLSDINYAIPAGKAYAIVMNGSSQVRVTTTEQTSQNPPTYRDSWVGWLNYTAYLSSGHIRTHGQYDVYWNYGEGTGPGDGYGFDSGNTGLGRLLLIDVTMCDRFSF